MVEICTKRLVTRFELFSVRNNIFKETLDFYFLERSSVYCQNKTISTLNANSEFHQQKSEVAGVRKWPELPKFTLAKKLNILHQFAHPTHCNAILKFSAWQHWQSSSRILRTRKLPFRTAVNGHFPTFLQIWPFFC